MRSTTRSGFSPRPARWVVVSFLSVSMACGGGPSAADSRGGTSVGAAGGAGGAAVPAAGEQAIQQRTVTALLGGSGQTPGQAAARYETIIGALQDTRNRLGRHTFDPEAVARAVGPDAQALFAWVRDNTRLVPYRGVLRGPRGVLLDRAGNSVDRALLLSELLRLAGHSSRIAIGALSPAMAGDVAKRLSAPPPVRTITDEFVDAAVADVARRAGADPASITGLLAESRAAADAGQRKATDRAAAQASVLQQILASSLSKATEVTEDPASVLAEHAWVQLQQAAAWTDLDPVFLPQGAGRSPHTVLRTFDATAVPADMYHTVRISLLIDRVQGSGLETVPVLQHEVRTADVAGVPIKLVQAPARMPDITRPPATGAKPADMGAVLSAQTHWVPTLVIGSQRINQSQFSLSGDLSKAGSPPKAASKGSGGFNPFGGGDEPVEASLAAQYLEYEIKAPGSQPQVERRTLFDWLDPVSRTASGGISSGAVHTPKDAAIQIVHETALMVMGSGVSDEFVEHAMLGFLIERSSRLAATIRNPAAGSDEISQLMKRSDASHEPRLLSLAQARFAFRTPDLPVFVNRTNILSLHRGVTVGAAGDVSRWEAYDIVANDVGVIAGSVAARLARLQQGVVDSNAESILAGSGSTSPGVSEVMQSGRLSVDQWTVVTNAAAIPASIPAGSSARARLVASLNRGFIAVLPSRAADLPTSWTGWWQVDPGTGKALAIDSRGWGGQLTVEQTVTLGNVFVFLMEVGNGIFCYYKAAQGIATESTAGTACAFASCTASMVFAATGLMKVTLSQFISPVLGLGWNICSAMFPPPAKK